MDVTGHWLFYEEFDFGYDVGICILHQKDTHVTGVLVYTEFVDDDSPFTITIDVEGEQFEDRLVLHGTRYEIEAPYQNIPYELDDRAGEIDGDVIIGQSIDGQDLAGDFILRRIERMLNS
jgi:hypothetical protein